MSHFSGYNNGPAAKNTSRVRKRKHRAADPDSDDSEEGHNAHRDHLGPSSCSEGIGLGSMRGKGGATAGRGGGGGGRGANGMRRGPGYGLPPAETGPSAHSRAEWEQPQSYGYPYPPSSSSTSTSTTFYPDAAHLHTNVHDPILSSSSTSSQAAAANPLRHLYFRAYEADLIRSADSESIARSLEVDADGRPFPATSLVRWGGGGVGTAGSYYGSRTGTGTGFGAGLGRGVSKSSEMVEGGASAGLRVEDDEDAAFDGGFGGAMAVDDASGRQVIWVDRYDIRLLLDALPETTPIGSEAGKEDVARAGSPAGWSDLSSDVEDTFFFSPAETEDFRHEKRQKVFADAREARMKALEEEERSALGQPPEEAWGGSDEEPDEDEKQLMRRTAAHLASAEDSAQLEIRILANFGGDKRFAFLRGRWSRAWKLVLARARQEKQAKEKPAAVASKPALGGLAGYGSESDSEAGSVKGEGDAPLTANAGPEEPIGSPDVAEEERKKEARRQRAKAWTESRKNQSSTVTDSN